MYVCIYIYIYIYVYMYNKHDMSNIIDTNFPPENKSQNIFNHNTVKVSYSYTQKISQII